MEGTSDTWNVPQIHGRYLRYIDFLIHGRYFRYIDFLIHGRYLRYIDFLIHGRYLRYMEGTSDTWKVPRIH